MSGQPQQQPQQSPMNMLETSLEKEKTKVEKIVIIIEKLKKHQGNLSKEDSSFYKILGKYITFLNYIKSIIEVKIGKDEKIIALQQNVFNSINVITSRIQNINLSLPQKEANISKTAKTPVQTNDNPNTKIEELNNKIDELNGELDELKKKQDKEKVYLLDFNTSNTGLNLDNKGIIEQRQIEINNIQQNCTKDIKNNVNDFITTLNSAQTGGNNTTSNSPSFQGNDQGYYDIINNNIFKTPNDNYELKNNNITINQQIHTEKLKEIKEAYENALNKNVENYKKICDALITLLENIKAINNKLKIFNNSKKKINEDNKVIKKIQDANQIIQAKNKEIQKANKNIEDKKIRKAEIDKLLSEISKLKDSIEQDTIIYKILDLQDIKNDEIFKANHEALVGKNGNSGLLGKITNAQSKLLNINIPQNTTQSTGNPVQGPASVQQAPGSSGQVIPPQGQNPVNPAPGNPVQALGTQGQRTVNPVRGQVNTSNPIRVSTSVFLSDLKNKTQIEDIAQIDDNQIREDIRTKLDELELLKTQKPMNTNNIKKLEEEIEKLFKEGDYTLSDGLKAEFKKVEPPSAPFSDHERYLLLKFISLLTVSGTFEAGLNKLNTNPPLKKLIDKIFKSYDNKDRQKLLIELYEKRPNRDLTKKGGKSKKSKNSKSKSKTSKSKSTKKQKATRTQVKSYNNPKYKNQDGGFVRGGVLFPESFYRSDIVM